MGQDTMSGGFLGAIRLLLPPRFPYRQHERTKDALPQGWAA
jgi:hypothetical protein